MCGIAGVIRWAGLTGRDGECAARLTRLLRHRGPDGAGGYRDSFCALVQARLALIGPSECKLPVSSPDGRYTIVYNGEVYNFEELRRELERGAEVLTNTRKTERGAGSSFTGPVARAAPFALLTDTEVVLAAWIAWGAKALNRLNGMYAFFVWDAIERRGFGACDSLGIKPFIYRDGGDSFAFASEAGALIESGAARFAPAEEAIAESLVAPYFSGAAALPFAGLKRLPPGHWLEIEDGRLTVREYFRFTHARAHVTDAEKVADRTASCVEQAVAASLRADAPVGAFLSGGVDSSLVTAIAQKHSARPLPAWTIAYEGNRRADYSRSLIVKSDDLPHAASVAKANGCEHHIVHVDQSRYEAALRRTLRADDLIAAWEQEVSQQLLAEAAASRVKAVLVGDAADETHFGYSFLLNPERIASPRRILEFFGSVPLRRKFIADPLGHFDEKYRRFAEDRGYRWSDPCEQRLAMSCLIHRLWLTRLMHNGDIHLMAHSLEGRVPFGDTRLLELARTISQEIGYNGGVEKWHLRRAAERFLDREIAWRPKSALTKNLFAHETIHRLFATAWREKGDFIERYVDCDAVSRMAASGSASSEVETNLRFRMLALMVWFDRFHGCRQ